MKEVPDMPQFESRIDFSRPELDYLIRFITESDNGGRMTLTRGKEEINLHPYQGEQEFETVSFSRRLDLAVELLVLGLERVMQLEAIRKILMSDSPMIYAAEGVGEEEVRSLVIKELKDMRSFLKKMRIKAPAILLGAIIAETPLPTGGPLPMLLPLVKFVFSLPTRYTEIIREIDGFLEKISGKIFTVNAVPQLQDVEKALIERDFDQAWSITDDLDGILGNDRFTSYTRFLAEFIQLQQERSVTPDTLVNRFGQLLKLEHWRSIFGTQENKDTSPFSASYCFG